MQQYSHSGAEEFGFLWHTYLQTAAHSWDFARRRPLGRPSGQLHRRHSLQGVEERLPLKQPVERGGLGEAPVYVHDANLFLNSIAKCETTRHEGVYNVVLNNVAQPAIIAKLIATIAAGEKGACNYTHGVTA